MPRTTVALLTLALSLLAASAAADPAPPVPGLPPAEPPGEALARAVEAQAVVHHAAGDAADAANALAANVPGQVAAAATLAANLLGGP